MPFAVLARVATGGLQSVTNPPGPRSQVTAVDLIARTFSPFGRLLLPPVCIGGVLSVVATGSSDPSLVVSPPFAIARLFVQVVASGVITVCVARSLHGDPLGPVAKGTPACT